MKKMMNYLELITIILYGAIPVSLIVAFVFQNADIFMYTFLTFAVVYWVYGVMYVKSTSNRRSLKEKV